MSIEKTLGLIKPNAVQDNNIGKILAQYEQAKLRIVAAKFIHLTKEKAEGFYIEHKERPFFGSLISFMTSGPIFAYVLEGEDAVEKSREVMGATNPAQAEEGSIRKLFGKSIEANAVHGSDSQGSAEREIAYFFDRNEIISK